MKTYYRLLLFSFLLCPFFSKAQETIVFEEDSLTVSENSNLMMQAHLASESIDSVRNFLKNGVKNSSQQIDYLVEFYLARYYYILQDIETAQSITKNVITDDYNEDGADARFYNLNGAIYTIQKKFPEAIQSFLKAADIYKEQGLTLEEYSVYNNIANIYLALGDFEQAYKYSKKCFTVYKDHPDNPNYLSLLGVLSICETALDMLDSASVHLELGLKALEYNSNPQGSIIIQYAKAEFEYKTGQPQVALPYALESLELSKKHRLNQYISISSVLLMGIYNDLGNYAKAIEYAEIAQAGMNLNSNITSEHAIANGKAVAYAGLGKYKDAYFFKNISDSLKTIDRNTEDKKRMDVLLVEYEALSQKNKILEQEFTINQKNKLISNRTNAIIIISLATFALLVLVILVFVYNRQRLKLIDQKHAVQLSEAISESEEIERDRISRELHDGLTAELTALKLQLEQNDSVSDQSLSTLNHAHQITRNISHNLSPYLIKEKGLIDAVVHFVNRNNSKGNLHFFTNVNQKIELNKKHEIIVYRGIQELIQNAIKYSKADQINVQIIQRKQSLSLSVEDNGIGMDVSKINNSLGLGALKKRIELIGGNLDIESSQGKGTTAFINLEIQT